MVCLPEVQKELAAALSVPATAPVVGHWVAPDYSCTYRFPNGSIRLVVRDVASKPAAAAYLAELVRQHGRASSVNVGADDAVLLKDGSLAARKDRHVLFVDVSGLPPRFGSPPMPRDQVAYSVGGVIMSCWKGDGS
ncbi:MAG: hypothetical protein JWN46_1268 [Acidimicrobiales bacterium]|nr:hypothetical protein [Acidimicrobiales bacterium]